MKYFKIGEHINDRYLVNDIKTGGMGIVYFCYDKIYEEPVALKTFIIENHNHWKFILGQFIREAKTWINIGKDRHVVEAYEVVNVETHAGFIPHIAVELIEGHPAYGESLAGWIYKAALSFQLIWFLSIDISNGMIKINERLHEKGGAVHRDLKPQNILLSKEGCLKITDFGLSKVLQENHPMINVPDSYLSDHSYCSFGSINDVCGTPAYMSPEQCMGLPEIDQRSDIYSFGCILYEMCTKGYVFQANSPQAFIDHHIHSIHKPVELINPDLPPFFSELINACLAKKPKDRPQSFGEIRNILISELRKKDRIYREGLRFQVFGFSYLSETPQVRSDLNLDKTGQALILGNAYGIDYAIEQGLVANRSEWDAIVLKYEKEKNDKDASKKRELELEAGEIAQAGGFLINLVKSEEEHEKKSCATSAISKFQLADRKVPSNPFISFHLGMSYNLLAEMYEEENQDKSNYFYTLAIEKFDNTIEQTEYPITVVFNELIYLLPYSAIFNKSIALVCKDELEIALEILRQLVLLLENTANAEFNNICEEIKQNAIEASEWISDELKTKN